MSTDTEITTPGQLVARWGERAGELAARAHRLGNCRAGEVAAGEAGAWRDAADQLARALAVQPPPDLVQQWVNATWPTSPSTTSAEAGADADAAEFRDEILRARHDEGS